MLTYLNDPTLKQTFVRRMDDHIALDQVIQGTGYSNGRGCAVGCTYNEYDYSLGPSRLGFTEWYEKLRDKIFEGLPAAEAPAFALASLSEVPVGVDLEQVRVPFLIDTLKRCLAHAGGSTKAVQGVITWLEAGEPEDQRESVRAAARAAWAAGAAWAADAAGAAARAAGVAAGTAGAAGAAGAAWAAGAAGAAWAAGAAGVAAGTAGAAGHKARTSEYQRQRDTLLTLVRSLKC